VSLPNGAKAQWPYVFPPRKGKIKVVINDQKTWGKVMVKNE
jgi:hypothetical protein